MQPRRPQPQRAPPGFTTTWPISPAAPRPRQGTPSSTSPPPTPGPHPQHRAVRPSGAQPILRRHGHLHVIAERHGTLHQVPQVGGHGVRLRPAPTHVADVCQRARVGIHRAGSAHAHARELLGRQARGARGIQQGAIRRLHHVRHAAIPRRRMTRMAEDGALRVDDHGFNLCPTQVNAAPGPRRVGGRHLRRFAPHRGSLVHFTPPVARRPRGPRPETKMRSPPRDGVGAPGRQGSNLRTRAHVCP
jgi:hypothetical protein